MMCHHIDFLCAEFKSFERKLMASLADLKAAVAEQTTVVQSAVTLLNGIHAKLEEALAQNDPAAIQEVLDDIKADTDALSSAVAANTDSPA